MQPDSQTELDSMVVPVYHGTRQSLAAAIKRDGLCPTPVADQIAAVAQAYGLPLKALNDHPLLKSKFSKLHADRAGTISTTGDEYNAGKWAGKAPEATDDALRAAFVMAHPDLNDDYAISDAADFWVLAQRVDDPPVVITLRAPLGALQSHGFSAGPTAASMLREELSRASSEDPATALSEALEPFVFLFRHQPEWRMPVESAELVTVSEPVPFRVSPSLLAFLSERSVVQLGPTQQCSAEWGPPGSEGHSGGDWWPFERVWGLLSPRRRAELEEFAGRSIQPEWGLRNRSAK